MLKSVDANTLKICSLEFKILHKKYIHECMTIELKFVMNCFGIHKMSV